MWRVLIVDDVESTRILLSGILKKHAECVCVADAANALREFTAALDAGKPFECVLIDYEMPETDGLTLIDEMRTAEEEREIPPKENSPLVMVTGHPKVFMKSFRNGGEDFILKPVQAEAVIGKVRTMVEKFRAKRMDERTL